MNEKAVEPQEIWEACQTLTRLWARADAYGNHATVRLLIKTANEVLVQAYTAAVILQRDTP